MQDSCLEQKIRYTYCNFLTKLSDTPPMNFTCDSLHFSVDHSFIRCKKSYQTQHLEFVKFQYFKIKIIILPTQGLLAQACGMPYWIFLFYKKFESFKSNLLWLQNL